MNRRRIGVQEIVSLKDVLNILHGVIEKTPGMFLVMYHSILKSSRQNMTYSMDRF